MSSESKDESFAALFERESGAGAPGRARARRFRVGDAVQALIVQIGRDAVFVEIDGKQQAFFEAVELRGPDGELTVREGETIGAQVVEVDARGGTIRLGRSLGRPNNLAALEQARETGLAVEGKVTGVNKGGLEVELGGARAFCPMSQIDTRRVDDDDVKALIGQSLEFVVTDVRDGGKNVVLSRRAHLARAANEAASRVLRDVVPGAVLRGTVTSVRDFGAFVDLGGVEGLIPRSEIGHDRRVAVADVLKPGETVEVQVREVTDAEPSKGGRPGPTKKITLSLKALATDPWAELNLAPGRVVRGTVARVTEFGAFVTVAPNVEGLLHISELGKGAKAEALQELLVVIKKIDAAARKISLAPAPEGAQPGAVVAGAPLKVGSIVRGAVERIETYGVFVQVEGTKDRAGRGLVPVSELGVPRGTDLRKTFPEGTVLTVKVLETGEGRLRLSVKAAKDAEERADYEAARSRANVPSSLGTFADLLKGRKL